MTTGKQVFSTITSTASLNLAIADVEIPTPGPDDVVVRIEAAPINPSDMGPLFGPASIAEANCKAPSWLRPCPKTDWAWWPRASIRHCRWAMNVPAQLFPPERATPPKHWMASWYLSCRALLSRNMLVCRQQPASSIMIKPHHSERLRLSSTR